MIVTMRGTTTADVVSRLVSLREEGGAVALGRVLTLVVRPTDDASAERAIRTANGASHEHPMRVVVVLPDDTARETGLDAEIRVGGDAGASDVVLLRPRGGAGSNPDTLITPLLLPDAPIVAWWPNQPPPVPSADPIGAMAQRRITEAHRCADPVATLAELAEGYAAGDTDLSWGRITLWRAMLAAALDEPPHEAVTAARVRGSAGLSSVELLAAWLRVSLGVPVEVVHEGRAAIMGVDLERASGTVTIDRPEGSTVATLSRPGRPDQPLNLPLRTPETTLVEELRRLDPDVIYGRVLTEGLEVGAKV